MSVISEQEYVTRIRQLERLNKSLAEQVNRQGKVVSAALQWWSLSKYRPEHYLDHEQDLAVAVAEYEAQMAQLAGEVNDAA
jgi:hypothetical protein